MKFSFKSKDKKLAESFQASLKTERQIESSLEKRGEEFVVEYSTADIGGMTREECCDKPVSKQEMYDLVSSMYSSMCAELNYRTDWMSREIRATNEFIYNHLNGHLPAIKGAEKMQKALDVLGIGADYEVKKPVIYSTASITVNSMR